MDLFNVELEQAVLGSCFVNNNGIDKLSSVISSDGFFDPLHQRMFAHMQIIHGRGERIDPVTISVAMKEDAGLIELGGTGYLAGLAIAAPALPNFYQLGRSVKELSDKRAIFKIAEDIVENAELTVKEQIEKAEQALYAVSSINQYGSRMMTFSSAVKMSIAMAEEAAKNGGKIVGVPTGLTELDRLLGGFQKSDLIIIAGRPGMGKTALATNAAFHAASLGSPVLFFSLEMSAPQLSTRILSEQSGVEMWRIRNGQMRPSEWDGYVLTGQKLDALPFHIDDTGGILLPQLASRARRAKREHGIKMVVIDYLQLMGSVSRQQNRVQEVTEITKGLKALAKELDVPIVALSQLSRGVDSRDDKRPVLSDLRESGSIEQDADAVMFVYRQEYYTKSREPDVSDPLYAKWQESMEKCHGKADVIMEKHRHGDTGTVRLNFDGRFTKFSNPE